GLRRRLDQGDGRGPVRPGLSRRTHDEPGPREGAGLVRVGVRQGVGQGAGQGAGWGTGWAAVTGAALWWPGRSKNITATNPTTNAAGTSHEAWAIAVEKRSSTWGGRPPPAASPARLGSKDSPCAASRESISTATAAEPRTEAT